VTPSLRPLTALIWKDAKVFAADRQAVVMSLVIPVLIATILGWLDSSASTPSSAQKTPVLLVDEDGSPTSKALMKALSSSSKLALASTTEAKARQSVREGKIAAAVLIPKGFALASEAAMSGGQKASIQLLEDPSRPLEPQIVEGIVYDQASRVVAVQSFGAVADRGSPVHVEEETVAAGKVTWAQSAHDYSGFGLQGLLFFAVESAVLLGRERRSGVWRRLKSSPVSAGLILLSRALSSTVLALAIILLMFCVGAALFGIRIQGSYLGFFGLALAAAVMSATFGLLVSTLGKTETQSRAMSILIIFVMLATGGAWFPLSKMPDAIQHLAQFLPVRWAVEGFDGTTWRALPLADAGKNIGVLLGFALLFTCISLLRFAKLQKDTT
jgi:ABC-2 type transport system permease protein